MKKFETDLQKMDLNKGKEQNESSKNIFDFSKGQKFTIHIGIYKMEAPTFFIFNNLFFKDDPSNMSKGGSKAGQKKLKKDDPMEEEKH